MYPSKRIQLLGVICTLFALCTSAKHLNHELLQSMESGFALKSISTNKHGGNMLVLPWENILKRSILDPKLNVTVSGENTDSWPLFFGEGLHGEKEQFKKLRTSCKINNFLTKEGKCEPCRQCGSHEVLKFPCTSFKDTVCKQLDRTHNSSRCVDLFKRKHNLDLLRKYWTVSEKLIRPHWLHKCFNYVANFSAQKKTRQIKTVHKRQAGSDKMNTELDDNKNSNEKGSSQLGKKTTIPSVGSPTNKFRSFAMSNNASIPKLPQENSTGTAPWVFVTISVAVVLLITLVIALVVCYRKKKLARKKLSSGRFTNMCHGDETYESCWSGSTEKGTHPPQPVEYHSAISEEKNNYYELVPLNAASTRGRTAVNEIYNLMEVDDSLYLSDLKVTSRSTEPACYEDFRLPSCLSSNEKDNNADYMVMPSLNFHSSRRDDGNRLRGGNINFQRRYVDVDYIHNDTHLQRHKNEKRYSNGYEQDSFDRISSLRKSISQSPDQEQSRKASTYKTSNERSRNGSNTSSSARSYISIPPTSPSENYIEAGSDDTSVRSERSTPPSKMAWLTKNLKVDGKNEIRNYLASLGTQTESDNDITAPDCKTAFGTPWQFGGTFTSRGGMMQATGSDVCLVVVANAIAKGDYVDIYGAVFTDTTEIRKKLDFPAKESLITPVVEYHAVPINHFNRHVCVQLPHAMPEEFDASLIKVYTFTVDERGKISLYSVPICGKANDDKSKETYWEKGSDGCSIHISTTHFSGYFCTLCETSSLPSICTMVFGSHVQITSSRREVRVILYIWDRRLTIKDYLERFRKQESDVDRQLLTDMQVPLLDNASSDSRLVMKMEVMGVDEDRQSWRHVLRPVGSRPLFKALQVRKLSEIVHCCRQTDPIRVEWALENAPRQIPSAIFQCCIDIMHVHESTRDYETAMREGSDELMRTFYVRDLKVVTHSSQELKPHIDVQLVDLKRALIETTDMAQTEKVCQEFGITTKDIGNFKKKYSRVEEFQAGLVDECLKRHGLDKFLHQLPKTLERLHLNHVLTALENRKIFMRDLTGQSNTPVQPKTVSPVEKTSESLGGDRDSTRCKSPYRRRSSSPNQRHRSSSPMNRRSRKELRGSQRPDLQMQVSERSDDVFVYNSPSQQQPALEDFSNRSCGSDKDNRQSRRHSRHRSNSPPSDCSDNSEENFNGSHKVGHNRSRYAGMNTEERQPIKSQKSSSSRTDSVLSSSSILSTDNITASSHFPSRSTLDPSMVAHADPKDFAEPYPDEFLDDYQQQTYKKEFAIQKNVYSPSSAEYQSYAKVSDGLHLSDSGPQAIPPESKQVHSSSISDPVPPYKKSSNDQRSCEKFQPQDNDQTLKKELYGMHTVV